MLLCVCEYLCVCLTQYYSVILCKIIAGVSNFLIQFRPFVKDVLAVNNTEFILNYSNKHIWLLV